MDKVESSVKGKWLFVSLLACAMALVMLVGCSGGNQASTASSTSSSASASDESDSSAEEAQQEYALEIGSETEGVLSIVVGNDLGKEILNIAFSAAGSPDAPEYLMEAGQDWPADESALVSFPSIDGAAAYDVYVRTNGGDYVLHSLNLESVEALDLHLEGDIAYATYELDGVPVSTLKHEVELAEQAAAEAEAQALAEAEAAAAEAAAETEYSYDYDYSENNASSAPAQGEQGCVDGGVKLR